MGVNRPTSHRLFRDQTGGNMKLFVASLLIMAVISSDAASLKVKSRKVGRSGRSWQRLQHLSPLSPSWCLPRAPSLPGSEHVSIFVGHESDHCLLLSLK